MAVMSKQDRAGDPKPANFVPPVVVSVTVQGKEIKFGFDPATMIQVPEGRAQHERELDAKGFEQHLIEQYADLIRAQLTPTVTSDAEAIAAAREVADKVRPYFRKAMGLPQVH